MTVGKDKVLLLRNLNQSTEMILSGTINRNLEWLSFRMSILVEVVERYRKEREENPDYVPRLTEREIEILNTDDTTKYLVEETMKQLLSGIIKGASSTYKYFYYKNLYCCLTLYATGGLLELKIHNSIELVSYGFLDHGGSYDTDVIMESIDECARRSNFDNNPVKFLMALSKNTYLYSDILGVGEWEELGLYNRSGVLYHRDGLCDPNNPVGVELIMEIYNNFINRGLQMTKYNMAVKYSELLSMLYVNR